VRVIKEDETTLVYVTLLGLKKGLLYNEGKEINFIYLLPSLEHLPFKQLKHASPRLVKLRKEVDDE
jgi:hypothetical protein